MIFNNGLVHLARSDAAFDVPRKWDVENQYYVNLQNGDNNIVASRFTVLLFFELQIYHLLFQE